MTVEADRTLLLDGDRRISTTVGMEEVGRGGGGCEAGLGPPVEEEEGKRGVAIGERGGPHAPTVRPTLAQVL